VLLCQLLCHFLEREEEALSVALPLSQDRRRKRKGKEVRRSKRMSPRVSVFVFLVLRLRRFVGSRKREKLFLQLVGQARERETN
jgi:hypothetical protein